MQFNKKLLDFDYGSDEEEQDSQDPVNPQTLDAIRVRHVFYIEIAAQQNKRAHGSTANFHYK